ncbi:MAG TPA: SPOR domain-containing protein, partial [Chakrabartia sp.]|nr:SPOR domain-containing protein [Chakrabartia sp.]
MSDTEYQTNLDDQDRLPWLEAVESDEDQEGMSASKLLGFVLAALLALLVVIGGVWWLRSQKAPADGDGQLITAQEGDYKVKANDDDGLKVEGQGDATFAASEGAEANGMVAAAPQAEAPVEGVKAAAPAAA